MKRLTKNELIEAIDQLRKERNAVILAHNYELGEVQDVADFCGDSLELSIKAAETEAEVIVFCGVTFMAETAYILSPDKTVLLPVKEAGCDMADMVTAEGLRELKAQHPDALVACYVNTTAAVKAECDICVTSANAAAMINSLPEDREIIFVPDANLGQNIINQTGRDMILWDGCCPVHHRITPEMIKRCRAEYPDAEVIMHPEAPPECAAMADHMLSTGGMCRYVHETNCKTVIIATESGIIYRLRKENPNIQYVPISEQQICPSMKMIRLEDLYKSLKDMQHVTTVPEEIRVKAKRPIDRMLEETAKLKSLT